VKAALLPNGESIAGFLGRRAPADYPLEGSGLNYVINPVTIHETRAWLDFHFEWPSVLEEIFPSASYSEYAVQHRSDLLNALYSIHTERVSQGDSVSLVEAFRVAPDTAGVMFSLLEHQRCVDAAVERRGKRFADSPEEAEALARQGFGDRTLGELESFLPAVLRLAEARFCHLGQVREPRS
jgi:hypothetical protein